MDNIMKNLNEYLQSVLEEEGGITQTPANTMGMGDISPNTDSLLSAPEGGIPKEKTKIYKRRKKKRKDIRDFLMNDDIHKA